MRNRSGTNTRQVHSLNNQATSTSAFTPVAVGAIGFAGNINAALSALMPFALEKDANGYTTTKPRPPGVCSNELYSRLDNEVKRWKKEAKECLPVQEAIFFKREGYVMRLNNLRRQQAHSKLAIARATLAAVCYPGYYGPGDHRQGVEDSLAAVTKCGVAVTMPAPGKK